MKFNMKSLLKDKNVLRVVALLSVLNLIGYLMIRDLDAVAFFAIVGFLTTYFSKNMIVVLLVAMVLTNFFAMGRKSGGMLEGMKASRKTTADMKKAKADAKAKKAKIQGASAEMDEEEGTGRVGELDHAATVQAAHENLEKFINGDGLKAMTEHTGGLKELMTQQKELMTTVKGMQPMMNEAMALMDKLGGASKVMDMLGGSK